MSRRLALLGVDDKRGLADFASGLVRLGFELLATGGTERALRGAGLPVTAVSEFTGSEEILDGRVKTLHPKIHAGILARRQRQADMATLERLGYRPLDLVAVNLYPFAEVAASGAGESELLEAIDIGGPTLLRAAAKNYASVLCVSSPDQYPTVLEALAAGEVSLEARRQLAAAVFQLTSSYDALVAERLAGAGGDAPWPDRLAFGGRLSRPLRYGENPHQPGALYLRGPAPQGLAGARQLQGDELSYTNWLDADSAWRLVRSLSRAGAAAAVLVKHTNPCGAALGEDAERAFERARECDPRSAYGGVVALDAELDLAAARALGRRFLELVLAPSVSPEAAAQLAQKGRLRVLELGPPTEEEALEVRSIEGGLLVQVPDPLRDRGSEPRVVSRRQPSPEERRQLELAWQLVRGVKSNAIVLFRDDQAVGIGAGQMSRVEAIELATARAGERARGSALASDGFFPMADNVEAAARAGVSALVHPGGSKHDPEVVAAADALGLALVLTGRRHFRH